MKILFFACWGFFTLMWLGIAVNNPDLHLSERLGGSIIAGLIWGGMCFFQIGIVIALIIWVGEGAAKLKARQREGSE